jgi:hypothetical protein
VTTPPEIVKSPLKTIVPPGVSRMNFVVVGAWKKIPFSRISKK